MRLWTLGITRALRVPQVLLHVGAQDRASAVDPVGNVHERQAIGGRGVQLRERAGDKIDPELAGQRLEALEVLVLGRFREVGRLGQFWVAEQELGQHGEVDGRISSYGRAHRSLGRKVVVLGVVVLWG